MKVKVPFSAFLAVLQFILVIQVTYAQTQNTNTTYLVALLGQRIQNETFDSDIKYKFVMTNKGDSAINVTISGIDGELESKRINSNDREEWICNETKALNGSEYSNKTLFVESENDFTLQVFVTRGDYVEGFLGIPIEKMNRTASKFQTYEYSVATFCETGGFCQLSVAAYEDETDISITLPNNVESVVLCKGKTFFNTGNMDKIQLMKYDSIQIETTFDLTGTYIYSFKPISVLAGSRGVTNEAVIAHTIEQLVPTWHWGTEFVVTTMPSTNAYGDILIITGSHSFVKIKMSGFHPFKIARNYQSVSRRLDKGSKCFIKASSPIQVIQISGLKYASNNNSEISSLSMSVVPSVQNIQSYGSGNPMIDDTNITGVLILREVKLTHHNKKLVSYSKYIIEDQTVPTIEPTHMPTILTYGNASMPAYVLYDESINGTDELKPAEISGGICYEVKLTHHNKKLVSYSKYIIEDQTVPTIEPTHMPTILTYGNASMPAYVLYDESINGTDELKPAEISGGICYDGGRVTVPFVKTAEKATPHEIILTKFPDHILKLRARFCGEAVLQFFTEQKDLQQSLLVRLSYNRITVTQCTGITGCRMEFFSDDSTINKGLACTIDMAFFWFYQEQGHICMGFGHSVDKATRCQNSFETSNTFRTVNVMGLFTEASFNWDFEDPNGCGLYEEKWRCFDRRSNCSMYGSSFCTDNTYNGFANHYCSKYCGKCSSDSYGRKYLLAIPRGINECRVIVSLVNENTGVAVMNTLTTGDKVVRVADSDNYARYYDCNPIVATPVQHKYTIITDDEVTVSVLFTREEGMLVSFPVYPVDTFGYEYMVLGYDTVDEIPPKYCDFVSEYADVQQLTFTKASLEPNNNYVSSKTAHVKKKFLTTLNNQYTGTTFQFDKPVGVYCGTSYTSSFGDICDDSNQLLPLNAWSTEYNVPAIEPLHYNSMLDAKLLIVTNSDNTIVNISEGFDGTYPIYDRGDVIEVEIDVSSSYRITSSENINVAMVLYNADETAVSFQVIPPVSDMHAVNVQSVPNKIPFEPFGFTTADIKTYFIHSNISSENKELEDPGNDVYRFVSTSEPKFGVSLVTANDGKWFALPAPRKVTSKLNIPELCTVSSDAVGDNIDGDCDKLTDEEDCFIEEYGVYRRDTDLDGAFGEDCDSTPLTGTPVEEKPDSPVCVIIDRPDNQCWTTCRCKCSWVEKYEATKNLTLEQLEEAIASETAKITKELQVNTDTLSSTASQKQSKGDKRQSAASIGYVGIAMFCIVFGAIFIMDIGSLIRDARILMANLKEGYERVFGC